MADESVMAETVEGKGEGRRFMLQVPDEWASGGPDDKARLVLKPFRSLSLALGVETNNPFNGPDLADVGAVIEALVERAEVILGIPDGTF